MRRRLLIIGLLSLIAVTGLAWLVMYHRRVSAPLRSVREFGPLNLGKKMPSAGPGDMTFAPYRTIPASKFYVQVVQDDHWCIQDGCSLDGALVQTMGGWLQGETPRNYPDLPGLVGLDRHDKNVKSLVVIGDARGNIAGIYLNRGIGDVIPILKLHPDLADFDLLKGVDEFGPLKIGEPSPLQPGDPIGQMSEELGTRQAVRHIPRDRAFYLYSLERRKHDMVGMYEPYENAYACSAGAGCRYPDPDPPHDFLFGIMEELGGWFLASDESNDEMMRLFGLAPEEVVRGAMSLVVLTDARGIIVDLHPRKILSDALTIISQHPELADVQRWYRN